MVSRAFGLDQSAETLGQSRQVACLDQVPVYHVNLAIHFGVTDIALDGDANGWLVQDIIIREFLTLLITHTGEVVSIEVE